MDQGLAERSAQRTSDLQDRLREEYGDFAVVEKTWRHPPHFYDRLVERFEDGHAGGAGAWVYDDDGRVLLVEEAGRPGYGDPGGQRQSGESFAETARRAVREATGLDVSIRDVIEFHRIDVYDGTDPDRPTLVEPIVVFAARAESTDLAPGENVEDADWFVEHPPNTQYEELDSRPIPFDPQ